jgi:hypothetical protein
MMPTKAQKQRAAEVLDKMVSLDDPSPMDQDWQEFFQRLCAKEAERLRYFLTKPLSQKARKEICDFERYYSQASTMPVVPHGIGRCLCPFMGRTLTAYRAGKVQSYSRRPKGKLYERV